MRTRLRHTRTSIERAVLLGLVAALVAAACSDSTRNSAPPTSAGHTSTPTSTQAPTPTTGGTPPDGPSAAPFSGIRLSAGHALADTTKPLAIVSGTPLDDAGVQAVTNRLPAWTIDDTLQKPFNWPVQVKPSPRVGATVNTPFPSPDAIPPPDVPSGPLHVLRMQPTGPVAIAPFVTITFDQPMVPITTVGQLDGASVPATISPALPGHWQWIGTKTLRFDAKSDVIDRLPMATNYTVTVPAGVASTTGGVLADGVSFQFSTPAATVQSLQPLGDSLPLTPLFLATFDQRVDPKAVLDTVAVRAGDTVRPVRLATADEAAADPVVSGLVGRVPDGRWVAFRPIDPFTPDTPINIAIGPGTPSAEGPVTTTTATTYSGRTYQPLTVMSVDCGYGSSCPPTSDINITFNNAIDTAKFDPTTVLVDPAIAASSIGAGGNLITIRGATQGRVTYKITIPAALKDTFGQQLGADTIRTVTIGSAAPMLEQFPLPFTTLDPLAQHASISVVTVNHKDFHLQVFKVSPTDWSAYAAAFMAFNGDQAPTLPRWPALIDKTVTVANVADQQVETSLDLSAAIGSPHGHVVVLVQPTEVYAPQSENYWRNRPTLTWAQATSIGLDASADATSVHAWTTDLHDGTPLPGVAVTLLGTGGAATTDADGLAAITRPLSANVPVLATRGDDSALLPGQMYNEPTQAPQDQSRWFVFDDRQIYRPGETVSIKGWVRRLTLSGDAQLQLFAAQATTNFTARDPQGNVLATGAAAVNPVGGFDFTFTVPADANLGYASVQIDLAGVSGLPQGGDSYNHGFQIEEFRRPEFEVAAHNESVGPYVQGKPITVAADANYFAGGPLASAPVSWQVTTASASYSPPGWDDFNFGVWTPWWLVDSGPYRSLPQGPCCVDRGDQAKTETFSGTTDATGSNYLQVDVGTLDAKYAGEPVAVTAQATVTDVNRQAWSSTTSLLVHPADLYVGLRGANTFVNRGDPLKVDAIVTDIDGKVVAGRTVHVTSSRMESIFQNGAWVEKPVDTQTCDVVTTASPVNCTFTTAVGGTYTITATVVDDAGRTNKTELTRWVSGAISAPTRTLAAQQLTIVPDQADYQPGGTAKLLVQAPFGTGEGLLTVTRSTVKSTTRFHVADGSAVVEVPIADRDIPNLDLSFEVVGATPRTADDGTALPNGPQQPAYAIGDITLKISTQTRGLKVTAVPAAAAVKPGTSTQVDIGVSDHDGKPVAGTELAVVVVDEAVLALSNYKLQDPLAVFYDGIPSSVMTRYGRASVILANPLVVANGDNQTTASAPTAAAGASATPARAPVGAAPATDAGSAKTSSSAGSDGAGATTPIDVRTNFDALAVFKPSVTTDASGHATIDVPLPDNLTRYRVMVVAVSGTEQFGSAQANITARLPLMVRPSAPRFLNFGDTLALPVVVQNQTDTSMNVDVVMQTDNLNLTAGAGQRVTVPANDRIEVRFPISASQAGTARFRVAAASGDNADSATVQLPVYTPATAEAFATYGVIDSGATSQPVVAPTGVFAQFGGLDITTSSTSLQALTDAVLYIAQYPYESSDARAMQIIAITSLRDVLDAFKAPALPSAQTLNTTVSTDVDALVSLQNGDGGFPYWERGDPSEPFNTIESTHALIIARKGGAAVPQSTIDRALDYLTNIEQHFESWYDQNTRDSLSAYALNVRMLAGSRDTAKAAALFATRRDGLPLDAIAWLWPVIADSSTNSAIARIIQNKAVDTADAVTFTTAVADDRNVTLQSDRRTDGLILDDLIALQPKSDLIPKVVAGLMASRVQGRWDNIQENSFILLAMKRYFDTFEKQSPDFVARVWLGDRFAGEHQFAGRSTDRVDLNIPTSDLIAAGNAGITIEKEGTGRLYYRIGLRTAPTDLHLQPLDRGFVVARSYEAVDNPGDVTRSANGAWHIKAGAKVRVRLTMVAESQRTYVALSDPLPAGLEILNPDLATTGKLPPDPNQPSNGPPGSDVFTEFGPWYPTWFDHQNLKDDRGEAFANYLPAGTYDYSYIAKATTPGTFVAPPTRAEEMYTPETFGRAGTDTIVIDG